MSFTFTIKMYDARIRALMTERGGMVAKDTARRATSVTNCSRASAPVRTGRLRSSIQWRYAPGIEAIGAEVFTNTPYALHMEFGTRPHPIVGNPILRFVASDGQTLFRRRVNHPGNAPRPFLIPCLQAAL